MISPHRKGPNKLGWAKDSPALHANETYYVPAWLFKTQV